MTPKRLSSHNLLLMKVLLMSKGDVAEVGAGTYSTPFLHWLTKGMDRKLVTYENNEEFFLFAKKFQSRLHRIRKMDNWDNMDFERHWGVVFIDHAPGIRRFQDVINFKNTADYIVMHDTEPEQYKTYGYDRAWSHFKYRYDWIDGQPHTSVVSNFYPVEKFKELL